MATGGLAAQVCRFAACRGRQTFAHLSVAVSRGEVVSFGTRLQQRVENSGFRYQIWHCRSNILRLVSIGPGLGTDVLLWGLFDSCAAVASLGEIVLASRRFWLARAPQLCQNCCINKFFFLVLTSRPGFSS